MRGLTLTQPWATLVALGHKHVETRSWRTNYTGQVAIHAAKGFPIGAREFAAEERAFGRCPARLPTSAIVAVAHLDGCRFTQDVAHQVSALERRLGDFSAGRYAWFLSDIRPLLEPVFCKGALGIWRVPDAIVAQLTEEVLPVASNGPLFERTA